MAITLVIQIITSNFPRVASRKKYMKLDVKGALLSYLLILLLLFFFLYYLSFDNVVLCKTENQIWNWSFVKITFLKIYSFYVFTKK